MGNSIKSVKSRTLLVAELPCNIHPLNPLNPVHCWLPNFPTSVTSVKSRSRVRCRTSFLTLLDYQVRGLQGCSDTP
ncbi:MAG: hypothetical protein ICV86_10545 [Microcoleus sp. T3-bin5]|nr:hypothetical protein [Microcoleus sp. T3-bin5]